MVKIYSLDDFKFCDCYRSQMSETSRSEKFVTTVTLIFSAMLKLSSSIVLKITFVGNWEIKTNVCRKSLGRVHL